MTAGERAGERIVTALERHGSRVRRQGGYWMAQCPAHEDRTESLSIRQFEDSASVHCFANCDRIDVMAAIGLTPADHYDTPGRAHYTYTDRTGARPGRAVHRRVGSDGRKDFSQSGDRSESVLYRLPRVAEAVAAGRVVYIVEGEKDVHALESLDATATTAPMGAGSWRKVDIGPLKGSRVVVVADQDQGGDRWRADVLDTLAGHAAEVRVGTPRTGKDAHDHVAAGHSLDELDPGQPPPATRTVTLTPASTIRIRPVHWTWSGRVAAGTLALLGGREGVGKSTLAYQLASDLTRGRLPGRHEGTPRAVVVCATEDSWAHTIVPRLMAAGADLDLVYRADVVTPEGMTGSLVLPRDLWALEHQLRAVGAVLVLLDPLMSRLDANLDTHRDAEVRTALEPLVALADRTGASVLGLIHVNKSHSTDPLTLLMASRAFAAVARSVLFVMTDPEDESVRLLGTPKNNLGRTDLPTLAYRIEGHHVGDTDEGPVWTGRLIWTGERTETIREVLEAAADSGDVRSATGEAADWLTDYLINAGGTEQSGRIKAAGAKVGHSPDALKRARRRIDAAVSAHGFPRETYWTLPETGAQSEQSSRSSPGESAPTAPTAPTGAPTGPVGAVGAVGAVGGTPPAREPTTSPSLVEQRLAAKSAAVADGAITDDRQATPAAYLARFGLAS